MPTLVEAYGFRREEADGQERGAGSLLARACWRLAGERREPEGVLQPPRAEGAFAQLLARSPGKRRKPV